MVFTLVLKLYLLVLELYLLILETCLLVVDIYRPRHHRRSQLVAAALLTHRLGLENQRALAHPSKLKRSELRRLCGARIQETTTSSAKPISILLAFRPAKAVLS